MARDKKFIITKDNNIATYMLANGFKLVSEIGGTWTFINEVPKNFNFEVFEKGKVAYSNILSL